MGAVYITNDLREAMLADGQDPARLQALFCDWKADPADEYNFLEFGKDGFYEEPKVLGERVLRHVHLPPHSTSPEAVEWAKRFKRRQRKTSDRCLVYAERKNGDYLLIAVLEDPPGAHLTTGNKAYMKQLADIAAHYIDCGEIAA